MPPILPLLIGLVLAHPPCLSYGPAVSLEGVVERRTFAGPPNYESLATGDRPMTYWILDLASPICVVASGEDEVDVAEADVRRVQLVLDARQYLDYARLPGQRVRVTGTLAHQVTGHHVERLLLTVTALELAPRSQVVRP